MARIFSIDFEFQRQQYMAMVSMATEADGIPCYTVSPSDATLKKLLPEGKIRFCIPEDLLAVERAATSTELALSLATALQQKLQPKMAKPQE